MRYTRNDPAPLYVRDPEQVGSYEAKTRLPEMLAAVEAGASFVITRHGRPVARLLPIEPASEPGGVVDELLARRSGRSLGVSIRELIEEGRR